MNQYSIILCDPSCYPSASQIPPAPSLRQGGWPSSTIPPGLSPPSCTSLDPAAPPIEPPHTQPPQVSPCVPASSPSLSLLPPPPTRKLPASGHTPVLTCPCCHMNRHPQILLHHTHSTHAAAARIRCTHLISYPCLLCDRSGQISTSSAGQPLRVPSLNAYWTSLFLLHLRRPRPFLPSSLISPMGDSDPIGPAWFVMVGPE